MLGMNRWASCHIEPTFHIARLDVELWLLVRKRQGVVDHATGYARTTEDVEDAEDKEGNRSSWKLGKHAGVSS